MEKKKIIANIGVKRNKKPLQNKIYIIEVLKESEFKTSVDFENYQKYKFKDLGYLSLTWKYEKEDMNYHHGFITPEKLKEKIGVKQWAKFCEGKREFVIQRRVDGKNI